MSKRMHRPESAKLDISLGDWLMVKKHLSAGERMDMYAAMMKATSTGETIDSARVGVCRVATYLLDWSITDADGQPVVIHDQSQDVVVSALRALDPESFTEILNAIDAHDAAMEKARVAEKNEQVGAIAS